MRYILPQIKILGFVMKHLLFLSLFIPSLALSFTKYDLCEVSGFFAGTEQHFMASLASHKNYQSGFHNDSQCRAIYASAFKVGKKFVSVSQLTAGFDATEAQTLNKADEFKNKILDTILNQAISNAP